MARRCGKAHQPRRSAGSGKNTSRASGEVPPSPSRALRDDGSGTHIQLSKPPRLRSGLATACHYPAGVVADAPAPQPLPKILCRDILPPRFDLFIFTNFMAQVCTICESKPSVGNMRSHSNRASKRRWNVNLQKATINGKQVRVCANCIKTIAKNAK